MAINPNSAFVRVVFDLPTPIAIALDEHVRTTGKSKKRYLADLIEATVSVQPKQKKVSKSK
jgi:hypothetical protein